MMIKTHNGHTISGSDILSFSQVFNSDAKLGLFSAGYDFIMMAGSNAWIHTQTNLAALVY
jgi:hypothetical protein